MTIPYRCQTEHNGQPVTVVISALAVPRCANCDELVFDYEADNQINRAFEQQVRALGNGAKGGVSRTVASSPLVYRGSDGDRRRCGSAWLPV